MWHINLIVNFIVLTVAWSDQAREENLLSGTISVIFNSIFKPRAMGVSIIVNISDHENYLFGQDSLENVMNFNRSMELPVAINQYTSTALSHYIGAKMVFTNNAENIRFSLHNTFFFFLSFCVIIEFFSFTENALNRVYIRMNFKVQKFFI